MSKHICRRCLNDSSVLDIEFDEQGVCSFCREYEKWEERLKDYQSLHDLWMQRINKYQGQSSYDVLVGISGGKDSTYVLYQLLHKYQLRVRTFTFDNGFLNDGTRDRIERVAKEFGVEHSYFSYPQEKLSEQYRNSITLTGAPCTACSILVYASTLALAHELDIPMAVHGRSRPQMLRHFARGSRDPFMPFIHAGLSAASKVDLVELYKGLESSIDQTMGNSLLDLVKTFSAEFLTSDPAEFVPFFLYHPYNERHIIEELEKNTRWRRAQGYDLLTHQDCVAHDAAAYLYTLIEGRPHILPEISVMIREGGITRDEAARRLSKDEHMEKPIISMEQLSSFVEVDAEMLEAQVLRLAEASKDNKGTGQS